MRRSILRRGLVQIHLWLGLTIGLLWALQGLTGAMLVFHREVDRLSTPTVSVGPMAPIDRIIASASAAGGAQIQSIGVVDGRGDLLTAAYADEVGNKRALLIDAASAQVVGTRDIEPTTPFGGSASRWLYRLHETLLLHDRGKTLIGISGIVLLGATLTGLFVAWPRRRQWRAVFAVGRWRASMQKLYGWHRATGLLVGMALLIVVPGGIYMIFAAQLRPAIARVVPHVLPVSLPERASPLVDPIDPAIALAKARWVFPNADFVRLTWPTATLPAYVVRLRQPGETRVWSGTTSVTISASNGAIVDSYDAINAPVSNRLADAAFSIHSAEIGGVVGRVLLVLVGLALPTLYVTGVMTWLGKRRRRQARRSQSVTSNGCSIDRLPARSAVGSQ